MQQQIKANGIELTYEVFGTTGEPLVLIMGLGSQMVQWPEPFCERLAQQGFQVIRFDNRDIGQSSWLDDMGVPDVRRAILRGYAGLKVEAPYRLEDMAADTAAFIDALGLGSAHVAGVSMGGMIAQTLALEHPRRVRSLCSIMSNTGSRRHALARPEAMRVLLRPLATTRQARIDNAVEAFRVLNGDHFPFEEARFRDVITRSYDRGFHPAGFVRQLTAIIASGSRLDRLGSIRVPTTVIHGTADPLVPPAGGAATARAIPNARLQWIEGMGHTLPSGAWETLVRAIEDNARRVEGQP